MKNRCQKAKSVLPTEIKWCNLTLLHSLCKVASSKVEWKSEKANILADMAAST